MPLAMSPSKAFIYYRHLISGMQRLWSSLSCVIPGVIGFYCLVFSLTILVLRVGRFMDKSIPSPYAA